MKAQIKKIKMLNFLFVLALAFSITSCQKEEATLVDVQSFTDASIEKIQSSAIGKNFCLEFVFPLSIEFVDGTVVEVDSYEVLNDTVQAYFEDNEVEITRENKPDLVFPVQVLDEEGEIIEVATEEDLKALKSECKSSGKGRRGSKGKGFSCFDLTYPITVTIGGVDTTFDDKMTLRAAVKEYKETAGEDAESPSVVFPLTITYDDGTEVEVASQEDLQSLKEACKDSE